MRRMDKEKTLKKIDDLYEQADQLEIQLIEQEARKILTADRALDKFVMAMGTAFFTYKDGGKYDLHSYTDEQLEILEKNNSPIFDFIFGDTENIIHSYKFHKKFFDMIGYMDSRSNIKGYPMMFTASGKVINDW